MSGKKKANKTNVSRQHSRFILSACFRILKKPTLRVWDQGLKDESVRVKYRGSSPARSDERTAKA